MKRINSSDGASPEVGHRESAPELPMPMQMTASLPDANQGAYETEENLEDEIEGDEYPDAANPAQDGRVPLRIEEEGKNGRFKRVYGFT